MLTMRVDKFQSAFENVIRMFYKRVLQSVRHLKCASSFDLQGLSKKSFQLCKNS